VRDLIIWKAITRTGGTAIKFTGASTALRAGFPMVDNVRITGDGTWSHGIVVDGTAMTGAGTQGLRDCTLRNTWVFNTTVADKSIWVKNGAQFSMIGGGIVDGLGANSGMTITGAAGATSTSQNVSGAGVYIGGTLTLDYVNNFALEGFVVGGAVSITANATNGDVNGRFAGAVTNASSLGTPVFVNGEQTGVWAPVPTNLAIVGGPPIYSGYFTRTRNMLHWNMTVDANGGTTASTAVNTTFAGIPVAAAVPGVCVATDTGVANLGTGLVQNATVFRAHVGRQGQHRDALGQLQDRRTMSKRKGKTMKSIFFALILALAAPAFAQSPALSNVAKLRTIVTVTDPAFAGGAKCDGATDDTAAIQATINAVGALGGGTVQFPAGVCKTTSMLTVAVGGTHLVGKGRFASRILFAPTGNATALKFANGANEMTMFSLRDMSIYSNDATFTKIALEVVDGGEYDISNVTIGGGVVVTGTGYWSGANSIGIKVQGREFGVYHNVWVTADRPLLIADNPNSAIDIDHHIFDELQLIANANPNVEIASGVNLSNVSFTSTQPWVRGTSCLKWVDTTTVANSYMLTIEKMRCEQGTDAAAYNIDIEHNNALQDFTCRNCFLDTTRHGFKLRNVRRVELSTVSYGGTAGKVAIDMTGITNSVLDMRNVLMGDGATVTLTNMVRLLESRPTQTTYGMGEYSLYAFTGRDGMRHSTVTTANLPPTSTTNIASTVLIEDSGAGTANLVSYYSGFLQRYLSQPQNMVRLFDDFLGNALNTFNWKTHIGSDGGVIAPRIVTSFDGLMRMTTGAGAGVSMAVNGVQLDSDLNWIPNRGALSCEAKIKVGAIANLVVFWGLTNQAAVLQMPINGSGVGDAFTYTAADAVGIVYDTAMTTQKWWLVGNKGGVAATAQNTGNAPGAGTFETYRMDVDLSGNTTFYRNGTLVGSALANSVTASVALTPVLAAFSRAAASVNVDADYVFCEIRR
jgi:hypothetical protein